MSRLFVCFSGASASGKSTIVNAMLARIPAFRFARSVTTRARRPGEAENAYEFVTKQMFFEMQDEGKFLESTERNGFYYATPLEELDGNSPLLLDLDFNGAIALKNHYPEAILILIVPPSLEELERRLRARDPDADEADLQYRLSQAGLEMSSQEFDYIFINNDLETTMDDVEKVLQHHLMEEMA